MIQLDPWQQKIIDTKGNIALRSGRQVGKSTAISHKAGLFAVNNSNKTVLVIAAVERQARLLFDKLLGFLFENYKSSIKKGSDKPTKHKIMLNNGSVIHCLPTGLTGYGIRGYTIDMLIADEAAFIPDEVWSAVTPMLAVTKGTIILLSTPFGKRGYFYECFNDPAYTTFHISSEDCPRVTDSFLEQERKRMTKLQYAQEYLGEFLDELMQFFPSDLVRQNMVQTREKTGACFLGVDLARHGGDECAFVSVNRSMDKKEIVVKEIKIEEDISSTRSIEIIKNMESLNNFKKIYIDDAGLGGPILDILLKVDGIKRKVVGINNAKRAIDHDEKPKYKRLMKEDLYNNLLNMLEQHRCELLPDPSLFRSLTSIQYEYTEDGRIKIFGKYTHIAEALIRAAWCVKDKGLNIWIA